MDHKLFLFIGPKAVGGTYWISKFCKMYPQLFAEIRSTTTRAPRPNDPNDLTRYTFVSKDEFLKRKAEGAFLETDAYHGEWYGTSHQEIDEVLNKSHVLAKVTMNGAVQITGHEKFNPMTIATFLLPKDEDVIMKNLFRRYQAQGVCGNPMIDRKRAYEYLEQMRGIAMPHETIVLSGTGADLGLFIKMFFKYGVRF